MRDTWYADNRDLVKWAVLHQLARMEDAKRIVQVAYYRSSTFPQIHLDGQPHTEEMEVMGSIRTEHYRVVGPTRKIKAAVTAPAWKTA